MEKVKKLLIVERSKYPDNNGKYVLCYIQKTDNPSIANYNAIDVVNASYNDLKEGV